MHPKLSRCDGPACLELLKDKWTGTQTELSPAAFDEGKLNHLAFFFKHLVARFGEFRQQRSAAWEAEVDRAARAVALRILTGVHHVSPHFPVETVLWELDMGDQRRAERVVGDIAEALVLQEKESDFMEA